MKPYLLSLLLLCSVTCSFAQQEAAPEREIIPQLNENTRQYEYKHVGKFDSTAITVDQAYSRVLKYIYRELQTSKDKVIADPETHEITFTCNLKGNNFGNFFYSTNAATYSFKVNLVFKPGRYRMFFDDFEYSLLMSASSGTSYASIGLDKLRNNSGGRKVRKELSDILYEIRHEFNLAAKGKETAPSKREDF